MFFLIGTGLSSFHDLTLKAINALKTCENIFLDAYTSYLVEDNDEFSSLLEGKNIIKADREMVEQGKEIIESAKRSNTAFLVVGDCFGATTHSDLLLRIVDEKIPFRVIHNASILNAVGCTGISLYEFGRTVSIPFWNDLEKPESFFDKIVDNYRLGLHTLCLLDIKVKEQTIENLIKGNKVFEPPRYMLTQDACFILDEILKNRNDQKTSVPIDSATIIFGLSNVGSSKQKIIAASLKDWLKKEEKLLNYINGPLHCMIVLGKTCILEHEFLSASAKHSVSDDLTSLPVFFEDGNIISDDSRIMELLRENNKRFDRF